MHPCITATVARGRCALVGHAAPDRDGGDTARGGATARLQRGAAQGGGTVVHQGGGHG